MEGGAAGSPEGDMMHEMGIRGDRDETRTGIGRHESQRRLEGI